MSSLTSAGDDSRRTIPLSIVAARDRLPSQLPAPLTRLVGRERDLVTVATLLQSGTVRLLTLTGPGGVGKTRLALRLANDLIDDFSDGVVFVSLARIMDPDLVLSAISSALQLRDSKDRSSVAGLVAYLEHRQILLVLDNFEHVVDAAPRLTELLEQCPGVHILVTSRAVLRVQGEQEFPVPSLAAPPRGPGRTWIMPPLEDLASFDAVALFVDRVRSVQPSFELTAENAPAVAEICARLDGLPLAIELAAARSNILPPGALLARLANRLQLLTGGARDLPARLQTMRSAIAWSYDLLAEPEQALFLTLSVFLGGFTLEAAEAISDADPLDVLESVGVLVNSSLLHQVTGAGGEPRFVMLETVREFGLERLSESGADVNARRRHASWAVDFAERADPLLILPDAPRALEQFEFENDNLRAALRWMLDAGDLEGAVRLITGSWFFWFLHGHYATTRDLIEQAMTRSAGIASPTRAAALVAAGFFAQDQGDLPRATEWLQESLALSRAIGFERGVGSALLGLADVADERGDEQIAGELFLEAANHLHSPEGKPWRSVALANVGAIAHRRGEGERAIDQINDALVLARSIGFPWGTALALYFLGSIAYERGDFPGAVEHYRESLTIFWSLRDRWRVGTALARLAFIAVEWRMPEIAANLLGVDEALREMIEVPQTRIASRGYERIVTAARAQLGQEAFSAAWAAGQRMPLEDLVEAALALEPPTSPARPGRAPSGAASAFGLTAREVDVLRLLVDGSTDRQIAEELFISHRTAQGHVASIFNKFGVNSRASATAAALRAGVLAADQT